VPVIRPTAQIGSIFKLLQMVEKSPAACGNTARYIEFLKFPKENSKAIALCGHKHIRDFSGVIHQKTLQDRRRNVVKM
jgi:hypothetical protein